MLNQDNWPEFYKEAASYFNSLGFRFELLSTEMAIQVGRTDQVTFILIAKYLENLRSSLPGDHYEKMMDDLGEFGGLFMESLSRFPDDYQYIFFITHQTHPGENFRKMIDLGVTTMMYIDAQAEAARVDLKDEPLLLEFMNKCVATLARIAGKRVNEYPVTGKAAGQFGIEFLLENLMIEAKAQYKLSRNVILN